MAAPEYDAVVVGSGPNGLAAATTLADAGASVLVLERSATLGGGARSAETTLPGYTHDTCSAVHPFGIGSPYLSTLGLERHGLEWIKPEVQVAHPLDDGSAATLLRSVAETGDAVGDRAGYERLLGSMVDKWDVLAPQVLGPPLRVPRHPVPFVGFGLRALVPATVVSKRLLHSDRAAALFAGVAAHAISDLRRPFTSAAGLMLIAAGHAVSWPVARGGSQRIADALVAHLKAAGGTTETGHEVRNIDELPSSRVTLFDTTPTQLVTMAGHRLPDAYRRKLERFRHGGASFKIDYALDGPVPWTAEACRRAGTVHLGGTAPEIARAERDVAAGRVPERPYVLVAQQSTLDPSRAPAGKHTLWVYCHVPNRSNVDMTGRIEAQIERFAPGFRDLVLARVTTGPAELEAANPNYVGGDIAGGSTEGLQLLFRPTVTTRPYATAVSGLFLCSSSTPPGGGIHGMCGHWAAKAALHHLG